jgi:hypothetical protein
MDPYLFYNSGWSDKNSIVAIEGESNVFVVRRSVAV